jgi:hypothetical protein
MASRGRGQDRAEASYAVEIHIRGVIHVQVERVPPLVLTLLATAVPSLLAWLATLGIR